MTDSEMEKGMTLGSGIAAFETKSFSQAARLLSPLAEEGEPEAQYRMAVMAQNGLGMVENGLMAFMAWVLCTSRASAWIRTLRMP
jgi:TPR repeat protein